MVFNMVFQFVVIVYFLFHATASPFDPYLLDGGLVTAVAGWDYILIASEMRLTDGRYGIRGCHHLGSRIWSAYLSSSMVVCREDNGDTTIADYIPVVSSPL